MVYCKVDVFVKMICYKVMTIEHEYFPIYLLGKPHKCVLKHSEQGLIF